jgi:endonuclease/exonuclease/phosphatase family metal-dependent hydrolase
MRLVSFNVMHRGNEPRNLQTERMRRLAAFIRSLEPDVVALQEVTPGMWDTLQNGLELREWEFRPRGEGVDGGEGVPIGILSPGWRILDQRSFWLSDTPEVPSRLRGAAHPRVCSSVRVDDGKNVWSIFNVHLDHRNARVRGRSLNLLQRQVTDGSVNEEVRVLCGDFNMPG